MNFSDEEIRPQMRRGIGGVSPLYQYRPYTKGDEQMTVKALVELPWKISK